MVDPLNVKQALRALVANTPREPAPVSEPERDPIKRLGNKIQTDIIKETPPGLLERAGSTAASGLSAVGNLLDVPGSMARDVLTWLPGGPKPANPFDQLLSPFGEKNRTTGRDLNRGYGLSGKEDTMLNFTGGMATEILTDPLTYLTFGASAVTKGGRAAKALGLLDKAPEVASRALGRKVGKREARHIVTPRMLLSDPAIGKADVRLALEKRMRDDYGLSEADMDRQLGGMAKINLPFSNRPFRFGDKSFNWFGLTDEDGVIGAGKIRGRGRPLPSPETKVPPPMDDGGDSWSRLPDDPNPPPLTDRDAPLPKSPVKSPEPIKPVDAGPEVSPLPEAPKPVADEAVDVAARPNAVAEVTKEAVVEPRAATKPDFEYKPEELQALVKFGYSDVEDIPRDYVGNAKAINSNPVRLLAAESAVDNVVDMVSKEGLKLPEAVDQFDNYVKSALDDLGLPPPTAKENDYAKQRLTAIERPLTIDDLIEYGKKRVADVGKDKASAEAERIFKKLGRFDLDEGAYYRSVLGSQPKVKQNKLLDEPVEPVVETPTASKEAEVQQAVDVSQQKKVNAPRVKALENELYNTLATKRMTYEQLSESLGKDGIDSGKVQQRLESLSSEIDEINRQLNTIESSKYAATNKPKADDVALANKTKTDKQDKPVLVSDRAKTLLDEAAGRVDESVAPKVDPEQIKKVQRWTRLIEDLKVGKTQLNKYSAKDVDLARKVGFGEIEAAIIEERRLRQANAAPNTTILNLVNSAVKNKVLPESAIAEANDISRRIVISENLPKLNPQTINTAAKAERAATAEIFGELSDADKSLFSGPKEFGSQYSKLYQSEVLAKQKQSSVMQGDALKPQGAPIDDARVIDLKKLEGLPEEAKPIVSAMVSKIGTKLFDDVQVRLGGNAPKPTTVGDIDMQRGFINIYNTAITNGVVDRTTVHELWHHMSKYVSPEEVRGVRNEFEAAVDKFKKANPKEKLPYDLSSVDEYFASKLTDLSMKYLGREKPVDLIGKTWAKAVEVFEYVWDAIRQTLGYDRTKKIMQGFLAGKRSGAAKVSDLTMAQRLADELAPSDVLESAYRSQVETPAFKNWFGDWEKDPKNASKVVDAEGKPLVVYHGTDQVFTEFTQAGKRDLGYLGKGFYFTGSANTAEMYSGAINTPPSLGANIMPVFLSITNPLIIKGGRSRLYDMYPGKSGEALTAAIRKDGYDGVVHQSNSGLTEYVAFEPEQIKSATGNRGTFDPASKNILESEADPLLSSKEVADQLSEFRSAKIGKGLDYAAETVLDSAVGRSIQALFDQSVLGQLSKAGQDAARLAFTGYRDAIHRERTFMSKFIRPWYETPNIREDEIIANELKPLDEYISKANGNKREASLMQLADARRIQNSRINDLRRLLERTAKDNEGRVSPALITVTPDQLPTWVGQEIVNGKPVANPARRAQLANLITSFRFKAMNMIRDENANGIATRAIDGYSPRVLSVMPKDPLINWNPNYGKLLDPTHPNQKRRAAYLSGYDDNTAVVNDISVDPEFSGIHSKKKVKQEPTESEIKQVARQLWSKYGNRLNAGYANRTYDQLIQIDVDFAKKISDLSEEMMKLNPDHVKYQIPLFSNDLFSAFELRLEHHYRSIAHAKAIQYLLGNNTTVGRLLKGDSDGVVLGDVLKNTKYANDDAIQKVLQKIPNSTKLEADKEFWDTKIQKRIKLIEDAFNTAIDPDPAKRKKLVDINGGPVKWNPSESKATYANIIPVKDNNKQFDLEIIFDTSNPDLSQARIIENVRDGEDWQIIAHDIPNPTNVNPESYRSSTPKEVMLQNLVVPQDVADAVTKFVRGPKPLDEVKPLIRTYDKMTNMWKMMQTGMLPFLSFHTRNLGSGLASNLYMGIQSDPRFADFNLADPKTYLNPLRSVAQPVRDAHLISTGQTVPGISKAPIFAGKNLTDEQATEELRKIIYANAIVGEKQGISAEQLMDTVGTAASQYPGIDGARSINPLRGRFSQPVPESTFAQRWFMPWMSKGVMSEKDIFRPGQLGRDLGQYTESLNRLSPFIAMIRQGNDPRAAAAMVNKAQVDYTMLSNFEREYMRRLFPFYSFTRGMTPTVYGQLMERPGGAMGRTIMATTQAGQGAEQGVTPDYIRETASIPLGMSGDGTRSYITGFGLPFEDPLQFAQIARGNVSGLLRELGSRLNPVPKSVIEVGTGRSLYQAGPFGGREIEDLDPTIGRIRANINDLITGQKTERAEPFLDNPWAEYLIANSGLGRSLNTIRTATDPRKYDTIPWKLLLNLGTGVRVADVSPSAQDAILRERLARVMKDFGGRMYSRPYFPDWAEEKWTPEQAADAAQIEAIMKLLNDRASERKRMEQAQ